MRSRIANSSGDREARRHLCRRASRRTPPKQSLCLPLMHQVIEHVAATKQHRDANQHRNEKRHDRSPFVVVLRRQRHDFISVSSGAAFLVEVPEEHSSSSGIGTNEPTVFFKHDDLPVHGMIRQTQSTILAGCHPSDQQHAQGTNRLPSHACA